MTKQDSSYELLFPDLSPPDLEGHGPVLIVDKHTRIGHTWGTRDDADSEAQELCAMASKQKIT